MKTIVQLLIFTVIAFVISCSPNKTADQHHSDFTRIILKDTIPKMKLMGLTPENEKFLKINKLDLKLDAFTNADCDVINKRFAIRFDEFVNSILITVKEVNSATGSNIKINNIKITTSTTQNLDATFGVKLFGDIIEFTTDNSKQTAKTLVYSISAPDKVGGEIEITLKSKEFLDSLKKEHDTVLDSLLSAQSVYVDYVDDRTNLTDENRSETITRLKQKYLDLDCQEKKSRILLNMYTAKKDFENKLFNACVLATTNYNYLLKATPSTANCFTVDLAVTFTTNNKLAFSFNIFGSADYTGSQSNEVQLIFGASKECL